jgi:hypothetical protein
LARLASYHAAAIDRCATLRKQLAYADDFVAMLTRRLDDLPVIVSETGPDDAT